MSFFEGIEPPPSPEAGHVEYRPPEWSAAPENVLPVSVAIDAVLVRTDAIAVYVSDARVYSNGMLFGVSMVRRTGPSEEDRRGGFLLGGAGREEDTRFGAGFADGRRTTLDAGWARAPRGRPQIYLSAGGGGGGGRSWHVRMWLWPLPPEGPLTFALTWPREGIDEAIAEVDTAPIRAAAARAAELWPDDRPEPPAAGGASGWSAYT